QTSWPTSPPAQICDNSELLNGPETPPQDAIVVPEGLNDDVNWNQPGATVWFEKGVHYLSDGRYANIVAAEGTTFIGAPGAVLDGRELNPFAFTAEAPTTSV